MKLTDKFKLNVYKYNAVNPETILKILKPIGSYHLCANRAD